MGTESISQHRTIISMSQGLRNTFWAYMSLRACASYRTKSKEKKTAASLITTNLYPRYHCDTTALPEGLEVAKLLVEHPGLVQSTIVSFLEATIGKEKRKNKSEKEK